MTPPDWIQVTLKVIETLDALGVSYVICGSVATIVHGVVRTTIDTDMIAELKLQHAEALVNALENEFYVELESVERAINFRRSFNIIHKVTMFKVDVFIPKERPFDQAQLAHRIQVEVAHDPIRTAWIASAEDNVLAKLDWFRMGDEVSERQWRDVLGVLKTQTGKLDVSYMHKAAAALGIDDLLEKALHEADANS